MFVLEDREHALARGATILAEIAGYGSTCDAYHRVQIAPDVAEPVRAMELAMADANLAKDEIGYINLHGTGTELNDRMETLAIKKCFNSHAAEIPMSSTKSMIGHPQGACGAGRFGRDDPHAPPADAAPDDQSRFTRPGLRPRLHPTPSPAKRSGRGTVQLHRIRQQKQRDDRERAVNDE